jgi:hypothetical protein
VIYSGDPPVNITFTRVATASFNFCRRYCHTPDPVEFLEVSIPTFRVNISRPQSGPFLDPQEHLPAVYLVGIGAHRHYPSEHVFWCHRSGVLSTP